MAVCYYPHSSDMWLKNLFWQVKYGRKQIFTTFLWKQTICAMVRSNSMSDTSRNRCSAKKKKKKDSPYFQPLRIQLVVDGSGTEVEFGSDAETSKETAKATRGQMKKLERNLVISSVTRWWKKIQIRKHTSAENYVVKVFWPVKESFFSLSEVIILFTVKEMYYPKLRGKTVTELGTMFCERGCPRLRYVRVLMPFLSGRSFLPVAEPATESRSVPAPSKTGSPSHFPSIWPWMIHAVLLVYFSWQQSSYSGAFTLYKEETREE